jgi:hypothetical protein
MKIDISEVESVMLQNKIDAIKVQAVINDLNQVVIELKNDKDDVKKSRWEHIVILKDEDNVLAGKEFSAWVVQQEEGEDAGTVLSRLVDAAKAQNERAKQKRAFLTTMSELFEGLKSKFVKEKKLRIKTKELTRVIVTNGKFV